MPTKKKRSTTPPHHHASAHARIGGHGRTTHAGGTGAAHRNLLPRPLSTVTETGLCLAHAAGGTTAAPQPMISPSIHGVTVPPLRSGTPSLDELLTAYWHVLPTAVTPAHLSSPWCLQASRVAELVFGHFGVPVEPLVVANTLLNAVALRLAGVSDVPVPLGQQREIGLTGADPRDDLALHGGPWYGHLVAIVARRYLVDAALRQGQCPERGVYTPRVLIFDVASTLLAGRQAALLYRSAGHHTGICYTPREPDPHLERVTGRELTLHGSSEDVARAVTTQMKDWLNLR